MPARAIHGVLDGGSSMGSSVKSGSSHGAASNTGNENAFVSVSSAPLLSSKVNVTVPSTFPASVGSMAKL